MVVNYNYTKIVFVPSSKVKKFYKRLGGIMFKNCGKGFLMMILAVCLSFSAGTPTRGSETFKDAAKLTSGQITQQLKTVPGWQLEGQQLRHTYEFENFVEAIAFVNLLVNPAESLGHHPDLMINYNRVTVSLSSHDAGGLTQKDFDLAKTISIIYQKKIN